MNGEEEVPGEGPKTSEEDQEEGFEKHRNLRWRAGVGAQHRILDEMTNEALIQVDDVVELARLQTWIWQTTISERN